MGPLVEGRNQMGARIGLVLSVCLEFWEPSGGHPLRTRHLRNEIQKRKSEKGKVRP